MIWSPQNREEAKLGLVWETLRNGSPVRLRVWGSSMVPSLWPGDILIIERTSCRDAVCGDIVLVRRNVVHRVIKKESRDGRTCLITRGDAVSQSDAPVEESELLGRVKCIQRKGSSIAPRRQLPATLRLLACLLRNSDQLRSLCLRLHSWRQASDQAQLRESVHV